MSKKTGFFILAGVGIGLVSGLSPVKVHADTLTADAKADLKSAEKKIDAAAVKVKDEFKGDKASAKSTSADHKYVRTNAFKAVPCDPSVINVKFSHGSSEFTGMSHDGAELSLINTGNTTCAIPGRPEVTFLNHGKKSLPITVRTPKGLNPGPVVAPVVLAHDGEAKALLRWVPGKVFDKNVCYKPRFIAVSIQGKQIRAPFKVRVCGEKGKETVYESGFLHPVVAAKAESAKAPAKVVKVKKTVTVKADPAQASEKVVEVKKTATVKEEPTKVVSKEEVTTQAQK